MSHGVKRISREQALQQAISRPSEPVEDTMLDRQIAVYCRLWQPRLRRI